LMLFSAIRICSYFRLSDVILTAGSVLLAELGSNYRANPAHPRQIFKPLKSLRYMFV